MTAMDLAYRRSLRILALAVLALFSIMWFACLAESHDCSCECEGMCTCDCACPCSVAAEVRIAGLILEGPRLATTIHPEDQQPTTGCYSVALQPPQLS